MAEKNQGGQEEKGNTILNKFVVLKKNLIQRVKDKKQLTPNQCHNIQEANRYRSQINKDLSKKIRYIQNSALGEIRIRNLNDEINKLLKEKTTWEDRIKELGGQDWKAINSDSADTDACLRKGDYTYWGAAKYLPGVQEMFVKQKAGKAFISGMTSSNKNYGAGIFEKIGIEYYGLNEGNNSHSYEADDDELNDELIYEKKLRNNLFVDVNLDLNKDIDIINSQISKTNKSKKKNIDKMEVEFNDIGNYNESILSLDKNEILELEKFRYLHNGIM